MGVEPLPVDFFLYPERILWRLRNNPNPLWELFSRSSKVGLNSEQPTLVKVEPMGEGRGVLEWCEAYLLALGGICLSERGIVPNLDKPTDVISARFTDLDATYTARL